MTNTQLLELLSFEANLESVSILSQTYLPDNASFILATLSYKDDVMTIPFIHYANSDFLITPCDWQSALPLKPEEIENITWRVNDTDKETPIINGLPRLPLV